MNKLAKLIATGAISVEDLANANELIERAKLVTDGIEACKKTLIFPLGVNKINCYSYTDSAGEYSSWATCDKSGEICFYSNWGGNHMTGSLNITSFIEVYLAFEEDELVYDVKNFLKQQITLAEAN